jgi:hypothetical protein
MIHSLTCFFTGGPSRTRTCDTRIMSPLLCRLSYGPKSFSGAYYSASASLLSNMIPARSSIVKIGTRRPLSLDWREAAVGACRRVEVVVECIHLARALRPRGPFGRRSLLLHSHKGLLEVGKAAREASLK